MSLVRHQDPSLETAQFCLSQSDFIFADGAWDVGDGDHSLDVMNRRGALTMKIRCRRFGESRPSFCDRTGRPRFWGSECYGDITPID